MKNRKELRLAIVGLGAAFLLMFSIFGARVERVPLGANSNGLVEQLEHAGDSLYRSAEYGKSAGHYERALERLASQMKYESEMPYPDSLFMSFAPTRVRFLETKVRIARAAYVLTAY